MTSFAIRPGRRRREDSMFDGEDTEMMAFTCLVKAIISVTRLF